jgi:acetyl esterase/lipase
MCGSAEILQDDSLHLHQQFGKAGIQSECIVFEEEQHVWPFMDITAPASKKALENMAAFAAKHSVATKIF